jgi:AcrR family transcriptional regulator
MARTAASRTRRSSRKGDPKPRILEAARRVAKRSGWAELSLMDVAAELKMPLGELARHVRDADAIADIWFADAQAAVLALADTPEFKRKSTHKRLAAAYTAWFTACGRDPDLSRQMLSTKLYVSHPHHWVPLIFHLSRLVQSFRDVAGLREGGLRRQAEEVVLTFLFLATLGFWTAPGQGAAARQEGFLEQGLAAAACAARQLFGGARRPRH